MCAGYIMALDIIGFILVFTHILTVGIIILWFGLGKPKSAAQFWNRFKEQMLGIKKAKHSPQPSSTDRTATVTQRQES